MVGMNIFLHNGLEKIIPTLKKGGKSKSILAMYSLVERVVVKIGKKSQTQWEIFNIKRINLQRLYWYGNGQET